MKVGTKLVIVAALTANLLIAATKFFAAWWTGSSAILSEGVHSLVDTGDQLLLLYGQHKANRPPDQNFPFGHGKEIYFWSFVVSMLVFALGAGVSLYEGINHIFHPTHIENIYVNYLTIAIALVFEGISWFISLRQFRAEKKPRHGYLQAIQLAKDPTLFLVLLEDTAALMGLVVALVGISLAWITGSPLFDSAASIIIGLILGGTAILLAQETKGLLVGEAARTEVVQTIREVVAAGKHVQHINEVLTLHMGPEYIVATISLDFADDIPAGEIEQTVLQLQAEIRRRVPEVKKIFIEAEPFRRTTPKDGPHETPCP